MSVDVSEAKVARNPLGLWGGWALATAAGMVFGSLPYVFLLNNLSLVVALILIPVSAGFLVGLFQWLVLRQYLTHSADWILHEGAGWSLGYALGLIMIRALSETVLGALLAYAIFGAIIGAIQWPVLRREIRHAVPWVVANVAAWAIGSYVSQLVLTLLVSDDVISQVVSTLTISGVTGLVAGAITGLTLVWTVRQPERGRIRVE
jgi:hypothetical protein